MTQVKDPVEPWKPVLDSGVDLRGLPLTPEEGFVASRLDGITDLHGLSVVTGLSPERIDAALQRLVSLGAVSPSDALDEGDELPSTKRLAKRRPGRLGQCGDGFDCGAQGKDVGRDQEVGIGPRWWGEPAKRLSESVESGHAHPIVSGRGGGVPNFSPRGGHCPGRRVSSPGS